MKALFCRIPNGCTAVGILHGQHHVALFYKFPGKCKGVPTGARICQCSGLLFRHSHYVRKLPAEVLTGPSVTTVLHQHLPGVRPERTTGKRTELVLTITDNECVFIRYDNKFPIRNDRILTKPNL